MSRTPGAKDKKPRKSREDGNKPAWSNSPIIQDTQKQMPEGYNTLMIKFMREIEPTEPLDINDVAEMSRRFEHYLDVCAKYDRKIGNLAAYAAIGITKEQAKDFEVNNKSNPARAYFIKKVKQFCSMYREGLMQDGKVNPVTGIFWQKNYDGLKDQQEVVVTPNNPLGEMGDTERIKQKYLDAGYNVLPEVAESAESTLPEPGTVEVEAVETVKNPE